MIPNTKPVGKLMGVYKANITQGATNAPTAVIVQNTTGLEWIWTRDEAGKYRITQEEGLQPELSKVLVIFPNMTGENTVVAKKIENGMTGNLNYITATVKTYAGVFTDGLLDSNTFIMEIYK